MKPTPAADGRPGPKTNEYDDLDAIEKTVRQLRPWFHNLHLPGGIQTVPDHFLGDFPAANWRETGKHLPENMQGLRALDVGCNAGFYAMELARRGARVTAIDMNPHYLKQARWAARLFGVDRNIDFRQMQVYELARTGEKWDVVLFLGTFYHLRHPLLALDIMRRITASLLIFQTMTLPETASKSEQFEKLHVPLDLPFDQRGLMRNPDWPCMAFIEHHLAGDPTNWWAANTACAEAMLRSAGFYRLERIGAETWLTRPDPHQRTEDWLQEEYAAAAGLKKNRAKGRQ